MQNHQSKVAYHYTSQAGLLGILNKQALRATDLFYLNDYSEFRLSIEITQYAIYNLLEGYPSPIDVKRDARFLKAVGAMLELLNNHHLYTASLSEEGDDLSQWKLYGSNFRGFSIGFDLSELVDYGQQEKNGFFVQQCLYDRKEQGEAISKILLRALEAYHEKEDSFGSLITADQLDVGVEHGVNIARALLLPELSRLKNSEFRSENEWRIVRHYDENYAKRNPSNPEFRESALSIIPYELIPLPKDGLAIKEIIFGPVLDKELTDRSLKLLLSKYNIAPQIYPSQLTIRNMS